MSLFQAFFIRVLTMRGLLKCVSSAFLLVPLSACQAENAAIPGNTVLANTAQANNYSGMGFISKPTDVRDSDDIATEQFYHALLAELYLQQRDNRQAADEYLRVAKSSSDNKILKKATVLAATTGKNKQALEVARRWAGLQKKSLDAKQYKALLLLRTDHYADSANMLHEIKLFIIDEANNPVEGAQFVSQLLSMETHHQQAYKTYRVYLNKYGEKSSIKLKSNKKFNLYNHQKITLASLAMANKHYKVVTSVLKNIATERALLLNSKAMNKLGYPAKAVALLKPWLNRPDTTDGLRFEYVRYSILSGEKEAASRVLQQLVKKHPDNKDLLKSLVAIQLNRKKWDLAEISAKKLMQFKAYRSDAKHFMGEIYEARGDNDKALRAYLQVVDGQLYKSALKHIPKLIEKQQGLLPARHWLQKRRDLIAKKAVKNKQLSLQKAMLYKAEADLLFAHKDYQAAQDYLQRALALAPADSEIIYARALIYEQLGQIGLAEKDLKRVIKKDTHNPSTLNALGYLLAVHTERLDEAMQFIKKAQQISPDDAAINDSLGWLHYRQGDIKTAEHYLRKSYQAMKQPDVASHLIEVLQKRGQKQEAKTILYQMLRQFPDDKKLKGISIN